MPNLIDYVADLFTRVGEHLDLPTAHQAHPLSPDDQYHDSYVVMAKSHDGKTTVVTKANPNPTLPWRDLVAQLVTLLLRDGPEIVEAVRAAQKAAEAGHEWNRIQRDRITQLEGERDKGATYARQLERANTANRVSLDEKAKEVSRLQAQLHAAREKLAAVHDAAMTSGPDLGEVLANIRTMTESDASVEPMAGYECGECGHFNCSHTVRLLPPVPFDDDEPDDWSSTQIPAGETPVVYGDDYDTEYPELPMRKEEAEGRLGPGPFTVEQLRALRDSPFKDAVPDEELGKVVQTFLDILDRLDLRPQSHTFWGAIEGLRAALEEDLASLHEWVVRFSAITDEEVDTLDFGSQPQEFWNALHNIKVAGSFIVLKDPGMIGRLSHKASDTPMTDNPTEPNLPFIMRVLNLFAFDMPEPLWWRTDDQYAPVTFFVGCNDEFYSATADCETITPDNIDVLEQAFKDTEDIGGRAGKIYAPLLFAARVRKMRPAKWAYEKAPAELARLLDECGPPRTGQDEHMMPPETADES